MYGIMSKTARFIAITGLAAGVAAIALPAKAGDRFGHQGGHGSYGKSHAYHGGHGGKHAYKKGYRRGYAQGRKQAYWHGHRYNHSYWRKYGHPGVTVYGWKPYGHWSGYTQFRIDSSCHPVIGTGRDHFGRRAEFGGTMCYDRFGRGYVVADSRYVIRYY